MLRELMIKAAKSYYTGQINKRIANIEILLNASVGIGEHQDIMDALDKELTELAKHHDNAEMLLRYFGKRKEEVTETPKEKDKK